VRRKKKRKKKKKKRNFPELLYIFVFFVQPKLEKDDKGNDLLLGIGVKKFGGNNFLLGRGGRHVY